MPLAVCGGASSGTDPNSGQALTAIGAELLDRGKVEEALVIFRKAALLYPGVSLVLFLMSFVVPLLCFAEKCTVLYCFMPGSVMSILRFPCEL